MAEDRFQIVAVVNGETCDVEEFLLSPDDRSMKTGLLEMFQHVAENGLENVPSKWFHEANKNEKIFEFIKGSLRVFFFRGEGNQIAVCTTAVRKKGQKADKGAVANAANWRAAYDAAFEAKTIQVITDEDE